MGIQIFEDDNQRNEEIREVIISAFKQKNEANLVEIIKEKSDFYLSFLAIDDETDKIVGHIMISPMLLNGEKNVLCLVPVSVLAEYENQGIGSLMIKKAIKEARKKAEEYYILTVLGSDHYYDRFGFVGYDVKKFTLPFEIEPRFFQIMELKEDSLAHLEGKFDYPEYFNV